MLGLGDSLRNLLENGLIFRGKYMIYEFAVMPEVFNPSQYETAESMRVIMASFFNKIVDNGLISDLNKSEWSSYIRNDIIPHLEFDIKDMVMSYLELLDGRNRLVRHPKIRIPPGQENKWLYLALESNKRIALHSIVSAFSEHCSTYESDTTSNSNIVDIKNLLNSDKWNNMKRDITIKRNLSQYEKWFIPILRYARKLTIIDPYMSPDIHYLNFLQLCFNNMGNIGLDYPKKGIICIHIKLINGENPKKYLEKWNAALKLRLNGLPHKCSVYLWSDAIGCNKTFHDRVIITDQCGIAASNDFKCWDNDNGNVSEMYLNLTSYEEMSRKLDEFDFNISPFKLEGEINL